MRIIRVLMLVLAIGLSASIAYAGGGTAFTYQGRLLDAGEPANGLFDLEFSLWDAANGGGSQIGITQVLNNTPVTDGLFTVQIDFGADAFDNGDRWLEVSVDGVPLDPRQPITRTPYSIQTRGIIVNDDQHVGMGVSPGSARLRAWNFAGNGFEVLSSSRAVEAISTGDMAILASNQSADGMGVFAQHQPSGNQGWLGTPDYGVYGKALDIANDWAGYFLGNGYFSGFVGIGTSEPEAPLHVVSADFRTIYAVNTATSGIHYGLYGQSNSTAGTGLYGFATATSGLTYGVLGANSSTGGRGVLGSAAAASGVNSGVYGLTNSPAGYGVYSQGNYGGTGAKYFIQPHPYDPSKEIRFVCLEGNESGTYFRGSTQLVDGRAHIHVPEEFRLVSETEGLTVQVTPRGPATLWVESVDLDRIVVAGNVDAVYFDYFVNGIRRGFAHMELIRENHGYVPEVRGVPFGTQYRPAHRQILVDNGILNPDFTPNKATAAMMGWTLRDPEPEDQLTEESKSQSGGTK